jgi:Glyoxalase-like domain
VLLQRTDDEKVSKERMHLDLESDDVEAEVKRLEALGATRYDHQQERGFDFWVMGDPWGNEFCVLQPQLPRAARPAPAMATYYRGFSVGATVLGGEAAGHGAEAVSH